MPQLDWRLFVDCASEPAARRVAARWFGKTGLDAQALTAASYPKGGFVLEARTDHASESWPEFVVEALAACQRAGHGWQLRGYVEEEFDAWSNDSSVAGVVSAHAQARRAGAAQG